MRLGVHLLGSRDGYRTLAASPDVSSEERAALEALVFGQTNDAAYLASLEREPAAFLRRLASGRCALTRLFAGARDDASRATLELRTLVMDGADYARMVHADLERVLGSDALWSAGRFREGRTIEIAAPPSGARATVTHRELIVLDGWLRATQPAQTMPQRQSGATAVLPDSLEARRAVLAFVRALANEDLAQCRWGVRLLSLACEVEIATAAAQLDRGHRTLIALDLRGTPKLEPVQFLAGGEALTAPLPTRARLLAALRISDTPGQTGMGAPRASTHGAEGSAAARSFRDHRARRVAIAALILTAVLVVIALVVVIARSNRDRAPTAPPRERIAAEGVDRRTPQAPSPPREPPHSETPQTQPRPPEIAPPAAQAPAGPIAPPPSVPPLSAPTLPVPPAPTPPATSNANPTPDATMPGRPLDEDVAATALERIRREELAAQTNFDALLERTVALLSALHGPDAKSEWTDHSTQWSKPHCAAVGKAMAAFDASLRAQSLLYLAPVVEPLLQTGDATATVIADRSQFLRVVPSLTGALASLDLLASEDGSNALATRANAATAINRANCVDNEQNEIRKRTIEFNKALNRLLGADTSGRPQSDTVKGARTRMQKTLRAGLEAHAASLPPALVEAIRRRAGNESR